MTIRYLQAADPRIETGPTQFGHDWPGVFIRGDSAHAFVLALNTIVERPSNDPIGHSLLVGLRDTLASCLVLPPRATP